MELYLTLGIITIGIFLFVKGYFTIDTTSLLIMALFIVSGVLSPEKGFAGFIHPATITIGCMFVISAAIFKTGIIDGFSTQILKLAKIHDTMALIAFCLTTAILSAFINDTAVVAIILPMALVVCRETNINPSKLLIPISFSAAIGGGCTLIGTGENILISSIAEKHGLGGFGMFEFTEAALVLAGIGLTYIFIIAPFLLPNRKNPNQDFFVKEAEKYTSEISLKANCPDVNKKIAASTLVKDFKAQILAIKRNNEQIENFSSDFKLHEGDVLKIVINSDNLLNLKQTKGYSINGDGVLQELVYDEKSEKEADRNNQKQTKKIYEVLVPVGSELAGKSLKELNFRNRYRSSVLAIRQRDETISKNINELKIREGDMLLIYTSEQDLTRLTSRSLAFVLSHYEEKNINYKKAIPALVIAIGVVAAAALNITSILISGLVGCLFLVTLSILKPQEAYQAIDWKVIFMMAGVLSMAMALEETGGSEIISTVIYEVLGKQDPRIALSMVFLFTFLSTNVLSSRATAALMTPIVISLASAMEVSERPFLVALMFASSLTFMTPLSNPTNTMVYSPGNYEFNDYLKVGTPLNLIIWIAASFIIPQFFPF